MKLLLDQNLSPRLTEALQDLFPASTHVRNEGLQNASDQAVWSHAASNGFVIVSKDSDFHHWSFLRGAPPKIIWIRTGNCTTDEIERLLLERHSDIEAFNSDTEASFLVLT